MTSRVVNYTTPACPHCGKISTMFVPYRSLIEWKKGTFIQDAFPSLNNQERELIKTGFHPACWDKAFPEEEE